MASPTPTHLFLMESRRIQISHNTGLVNHYTAQSLQISPQSLPQIHFIRTITNRGPEIPFLIDEAAKHMDNLITSVGHFSNQRIPTNPNSAQQCMVIIINNLSTPKNLPFLLIMSLLMDLTLVSTRPHKLRLLFVKKCLTSLCF